jgi:spore coat polysaccharide biosynthesis protein SpsF
MRPLIDAMIQARVGSTRLPGKVLLPLGNATTLGTMIERVKRARSLGRVIVLTTELAEDDAVAGVARDHGVAVFRGATHDVLARYHDAAVRYGSDAVVRLTGDCPFMDPALIDAMVRLFAVNWPRMGVLTNCYHRTYARGLDIEILSRDVVETLHARCREPQQREHVVPYLEEHPAEFAFFEYPNAADDSWCRVTLDTPADYETIATVYAAFGHDRFSYGELMDVLRRRPELLRNRDVVHKAYRS